MWMQDREFVAQDAWNQMTGAFWNWHSVTYVIKSAGANRYGARQRATGFLQLSTSRILFLESGVTLSVWKSSKPNSSQPDRLFCFERNGPAYPLPEYCGRLDTGTNTAGRALISRIFKASRSYVKT
jgi:hypothetical protein